MRALVSRPELIDPILVDLPDPSPGPGEVLVAVGAAGVNPADLLVAAGTLREVFDLEGQVGLGSDIAGTVVATAPDVTGFAVGDRVAGLSPDLSAPTRAQAELAVVPAAHLAHVPAGLDLIDAASIPLNSLTAVQALDLLGTPAGRTLLVTGAAGGVGGYAVALAAATGWRVTGLARDDDAEFVRSAGAEALVTSLPFRTFDAVVDAAALQTSALDAVRDGGAFVGVLPPDPVTPQRGITVQEVFVQPDGVRLAELLRRSVEGELAVRIADTAPLSEFHLLYEGGTRSRGRRILLVT